MMKRIIFVDSDGTLKNNEGVISEKTINTLKELKANEIDVVITTGRPRYHALKVKNKSNASRYVISSNGAEVYDEEENKIIFANYLSKDAVIKITNIANRYNSRCVYTIEGKEYVSDEVKNEHQVLLNEDLETFLNKNYVKQIFIRADDTKSINKTYKKIKKLSEVKIVNQSSYFQTGIVEEKGLWFSVADCKVNKGNAIMKLCEYLNIELINTYGFGNDYNDISMFNAVKYSIVMDNANEDLKKKARIIAKSNDEDGVANLLEELFLKERKENE